MKPTGRSFLNRAGVVASILAIVALAVLPSTARAATGDISTVAGGGVGDGGLAISASLNTPGDVAVDAMGNLFIADEINNRIRKVAASTGVITTVAGVGSSRCG
jgi:hypothetical protein